MTRPTLRSATAGVTLVEVLVALVLFALIGGAGFGMLDQILRTQAGTEGRLERLAQIQRGMYLLSTDFRQARSGTLSWQDGEAGPVLSVGRSAAETGAGWITLTYQVQEGVLLRDVASAGGDPVARQSLLSDVAGIAWQFYDPGVGWVDQWPPPRAVAVLSQRPPNPVAVAAIITLADDRQLRRVATLPSEPR
ncbi:hypothetical protein E4L95_04505 [Paracoccus liaowanqingii]|uniref:Type II secretion system protein J n=1 Tax=Paracoccus liaowanqingii TaxID=2560053 RepID=A0A4Z1CQZ0_9RHOB|nr:type II secretion system protein GspJ [Paracoccus liaowanqingii]QDA36471.1 hypothetical protein E4191_20440 [Paracoccus liaowanqingii]TGN67547.1 hypothetical protein E4L95_04505 [Paracoccus liaowanqingii]